MLLAVLPFVREQRHVLVFGSTCRTLQRAAAPDALQRGVTLRHARYLAAFLTFVNRDTNLRSRAVQALRIELSDVQDLGRDSERVAEILGRCSSIKSLRLSGHLLDVDPRIGVAFVKLEHLEYLDVFRAHYTTSLVPFLASMRSRCSQVRLDYNLQPDDTGLYDIVQDDPNMALVASKDTLKELWISAGHIFLDVIVYTNLTTLVLNEWWSYDLRPLLRSFPHLQRLTLATTSASPWPLEDLDREEIREHNIQASYDSPWVDLREFHGSIAALYMLGLTCPIRRWRIPQDDDCPIVDEALEAFSLAVNTTSCIGLDLALGTDDLEFGQIVHALKAVQTQVLDFTLRVCLMERMPSYVDRLMVDFNFARYILH